MKPWGDYSMIWRTIKNTTASSKLPRRINGQIGRYLLFTDFGRLYSKYTKRQKAQTVRRRFWP